MLEFFSGSTRMVNTRRGVNECLEIALGNQVSDCDLILIHASIGHSFQEMVDEAALTMILKSFRKNLVRIINSLIF